MCTAALIDASAFGVYLEAGQDRPLRRWIRDGHGIVMYAGVGRYADELRKSPRMSAAIAEYRTGGTARLVPEADIEHADRDLRNVLFKSNDRHMLALATAGRVSVLHSTDRDLQMDFKRPPKVGTTRRAVYPTSASRRLRQQFLDQRRCPNRMGGT